MKLTNYEDARDFLAAAGDILRSDEVRYGLIYGIVRATAENPHHYGEENPWFCTVGDGQGIHGMAWRTPPYQPGLVYVSGDPEFYTPLLIDEVRSRWPVIPGVTGDREIVSSFVKEWCRVQGTHILQTIEMRLYRLDSINDVNLAPGKIRDATTGDKQLAEKWVDGFNRDCFGVSASSRPQQDVMIMLEKGKLFLWEHGGVPVSMCATTRPTDTGMAISFVYTPPEQRGKGYATSCVAAVCRGILSRGKAFCSLYADLSNPYSNAAYTRVGFKPVCDSLDYTFSLPG